MHFSLYIHIIIKNAYIIKNELLIYQFLAFTSFHQVQLKLEMLYSKCNLKRNQSKLTLENSSKTLMLKKYL